MKISSTQDARFVTKVFVRMSGIFTAGTFTPNPLDHS